MNKTIGFFGDSFCEEYYCRTGNKTYIQMLADHYDAKIVSLGKGGSSIWDVLLNQLDPFIQSNSIPDICVFVWTEHARLFHQTVRNINFSSVEDNTGLIWNAAKEFYHHLYNNNLSIVQYVAGLRYIDDVVISSFPTHVKVVHLWSFGVPSENNKVGFQPDNIRYLHTWKNGIEIRPSMMSIALDGHTFDEVSSTTGNNESDPPNHLVTHEKNIQVFQLIRDAIDV